MGIEQTVDLLKNLIFDSHRYKEMDKFIGEFFLIAATLDKRGRIISIGENSLTKTHPLMNYYSNKTKMKHKIYLHAELSAIVKSFTLAYSIVVIRINRSGKLAMARPCPICTCAIKEAKIKKIWFSNAEGGITMIPVGGDNE